MRGRHPLGDRVMLAELCVLFSVLSWCALESATTASSSEIGAIYLAQSATGLGGELKKVV